MDTAADLDKLYRGLAAAHKAGRKDHAQVYADRIKAVKSQGEGQSSLSVGLNNITEGVADSVKTAGQALGFEGGGAIESTLRNSVDNPTAPTAGEKFTAPEGTFNFDLGDNYENLAGFIVEQAPQLGASMAAGAAGGAVAGPVGALAGTVAMGVAQLWGSLAQQRAKANGRDKPNAEDMGIAAGTAAVSGAIDRLGPAGKTVLGKFAKETVGEMAQDVTEQVGGTAGTDQGLQYDPKQTIASGIAGGGTMGVAAPIQSATHAVANVELPRSRNSEPTDAEIHAGERLRAIAGDAGLGEVRSTDSESDRGKAKAALQEVRAEVRTLASGMKSLAESDLPDATEAKAAIKALVNVSTDMKSNVPESMVRKLKAVLPGQEQAVDKLAELAREASVLHRFTSERGDMGGISKITSQYDITDSRRDGRALIGLGLGSVGTAIPAGIAVNRIARGIDNLTGRRSAVERLVNKTADWQAPRVDFRHPDSILAERKAKADAAKQAEADRKRQEADTRRAEADQRRLEADKRREENLKKKAAKEQAVAQVKAKEEADRINARNQTLALNKQNYEAMIASGKADKGIPFQEPYAVWEEYTGLGPKATFDAILAMEQDGSVPQGTSQQWADDIRSFKVDSSPEGQRTYALQEAIRNKFNPTHKRKTSPKAQEVLAKIAPASSLKTGVDEAKFRQQNGQRISKNVNGLIENNKGSLTTEQYKGLKELHHKVDSYKTTRSRRQNLIDKVVPKLFENDPVMADYWHKAFTDLAQAGNDYVPKVEDKNPKKKSPKVLKGLVLDQYGKPIM